MKFCAKMVHNVGRDDIKKDGFVFKYPDKKNDALIGIIKIESFA
jgi:hypothetical protein